MSEPTNSLDLADKFGATTLSNYEIYMIGEAVVNWLGTVARLGHASPASTLDYTLDPHQMSLGGLVVRDFVAWTSGRTHLAEGCEARLREWIDAADLDADIAARVDTAMRVA